MISESMTPEFRHVTIPTPQMVVEMLLFAKLQLEAPMKKNAHYRRAVWLDGGADSLGACIEQCVDQIDDAHLPRFDLGDGSECLLARRSAAGGNRYLHFVVFESGAPVAVINTILQDGAPEIEPDEQDPQDGREYIQAQLFCLVRGNHILWSTHNYPLREAAIYKIFCSFFENFELDPNTKQFGFQVHLDEAIVKQAFDAGISEIDLGVGALRPTLDRLVDGGQLRDIPILSRLAPLVMRRPTADDLDASEFIESKLVLKPGRNWDKPHVLDLMSSIASSVRNNFEEEFVIVTKTGVRLTRDKMSLQREVEADGNKRILVSAQLDNALRSAMHSLDEDGILDA